MKADRPFRLAIRERFQDSVDDGEIAVLAPIRRSTGACTGAHCVPGEASAGTVENPPRLRSTPTSTQIFITIRETTEP